ncbi:MAG: cytochrome c3 family protein [Thermodesulfobacteriota bacterium]
MKNMKKITFFLLSFTFYLFVVVNPSRAGIIANSVHNLSSSGPGPIKAASPPTSDTEICVFCHTPHHGNTQGVLWNKEDAGVTYTPYGSTTIIAAPSQPDGSSRLCLSCHDGSIAIGSLLNLPGAIAQILDNTPQGTIAMTDSDPSNDCNVSARLTPDGKLCPQISTFLGIDLRDDHPISFLYSASASNTEIKPPGSITAPVKLDNNGKVQCTSCHDPHDDAYPNFLLMDYGSGSPICTACHSLTSWNATDNPVHRNSTATWTGTLGTDSNPWHIDLNDIGNSCESTSPLSGNYCDDTLAMHGCFSCHRSHTGAIGMMLLKGENPLDSTEKGEEWSCIPCHNGNLASTDIETELDGGLSNHPVKGASNYNLHSPERYPAASDPIRENRDTLGASRHAECPDCHNSHVLKTGNHIQGTDGNVIGLVLLGSWGVMPTGGVWPAAGSAVSSFSEIEFDTDPPSGISDSLEGYLCLKCHSAYATDYGISGPNVPSDLPDGSPVLAKDLTLDFNPNIHSFHPVFSQGMNQPLCDANTNWPDIASCPTALGLTNTFMYKEDSTNYPVQHIDFITCTDCHEPHGSGNKWLLKDNITGSGTFVNFCYNCHRRDVYGDENYDPPYGNYSRVTHPVDGLNAGTSPFYKSGIDTGNNSNKWGILCLSCHGGGYDSTNDNIEAIHGSNKGIGNWGTDELGRRLMNGAAVLGHTMATKPVGACNTANKIKMWLKTDTTDPLVNDPVNNYDWSITYGYYLNNSANPAYFRGNCANYDY